MKHLTKFICLAVLTNIVGGCATQGQGLLPASEDMRTTDIYKKVIHDNKYTNLSYDFKEQRVAKPKYSGHMQGEVNKVNKKFLTLPNPQIPMYIFAHRVQAGSEMIPVLGYTTVFHLYKQEQFALPTERY